MSPAQVLRQAASIRAGVSPALRTLLCLPSGFTAQQYNEHCQQLVPYPLQQFRPCSASGFTKSCSTHTASFQSCSAMRAWSNAGTAQPTACHSQVNACRCQDPGNAQPPLHTQAFHNLHFAVHASRVHASNLVHRNVVLGTPAQAEQLELMHAACLPGACCTAELMQAVLSSARCVGCKSSRAKKPARCTHAVVVLYTKNHCVPHEVDNFSSLACEARAG